MSRTQKKPEKKTAIENSTSVSREGGLAPGEVLNLSEAAGYLRLAESDVLRLVHEQGLPGRQLGVEWRFLKTAIQDWLGTGPPPRGSKEAQLAVAGSWKDDPYVEEELKEIYRQRGRPMTADES